MNVFLLVIEYHDSYSSYVQNALLFKTRDEVDAYIRKCITSKPFTWETSMYAKPWLVKAEIPRFENQSSPCYLCYLFEQTIWDN